MKLFGYLLDRAKEKSSVLTVLTLIIGGLGLSITPEFKDAIVNALVAVLSAIAIATKEAGKNV